MWGTPARIGCGLVFLGGSIVSKALGESPRAKGRCFGVLRWGTMFAKARAGCRVSTLQESGVLRWGTMFH